MSQIYNSDLTNEIRDGAKIQQNVDTIPNQLADKVVPVMEVNPKLLRVVNFIVGGTSNTTGSTSIMTLPTDKDTFLTDLTLEVSKNVTCDSVYVELNATLKGGKAVQLAYLHFQTLTLTDNINISKSFTVPIQLERGSQIAVNGNFAAGASSRGVQLFGYQVENIKA